MILVDASVWIDHLRSAEPALTRLLTSSGVLAHPMVVGELALGDLADRGQVLELLGNLPGTVLATHDEVFDMVGRERLFGLGLVDAHLLASIRLTPGARLWTRDWPRRAPDPGSNMSRSGELWTPLAKLSTSAITGS